MPCVIDDCKIPLFLKDKLYADFRSDPDKAFRLVDRSLGRISNATQGRSESPDFFTDWALDWNNPDKAAWCFRWTFVDHGPNLPYVVVSECTAHGDKKANKLFKKALSRKEHMPFIRRVLAEIVKEFNSKPLSGLIDDNHGKYVGWKVRGKGDEEFTMIFTYRRMGIDNGMDTYVHLDNNLRTALKHMDDVDYKPHRP
jgi:hypothetical protein